MQLHSQSPEPPVASPQVAAQAGVVTPTTTGATAYPAPRPIPVPLAASNPGARLYAAGAYDSGHNRDVEFGGYTSAGVEANDTWTWDGTTWALQAPATSPSARDSASMAYDAATGTTVLFGGNNGSGDLNDTWSWNGTTWTQLAPSASPPAREWASMAYDSALGEIVLFGGCGATSVLADTWVWNGSTWSAVATPGGLVGRETAGMSYDANAGDIVLYGGVGSDGTTYFGDTWLYGSNGWTQASPTHYPGPRAGMGMAYDTVLREVVLVGGVDTNNTYGDQWMWDGSDWRQGADATDVPPDSEAVFLTAAGNGQLMIQGGYDWAASGGYYDATNLFDWSSAGSPKGNSIITHPIDDRSTIGVNPYGLNLRWSATDLSASGVGEDLNLTREFNSDTTATIFGAAGFGWSFTNSIDTRMADGYTDAALMIFGLRGTSYTSYFAVNHTTGAYISPTGLNADLVALGGGGFTLTYHSSSEKLTFNASGQLTSDVDRNGNGTTIAYNGYEATTITDGHGRVYTLTYGSNGFLHTITAPGGRVVTYTQDANDYLSTVTDAANELTTYSYPAGEFDIEDPRANITKTVESEAGVTITDPQTTPNTTTYQNVAPDAGSGAWEKTTVTDQNAHVTTYNVAYNGDVLKATDALGHSRSTTYTPNNDVATAVDALGVGNTTSYNYDASNNPTSVTIPTGAKATAQYSSGSGCTSSDTTHPYLAKCTTDPQGNQGTFTYDGPGNVTSSKVPAAGRSLTYTYNPATPTCGGKVGQQCTSVDGNNHTTSYTYNSAGDLTTITPPTPQGATTQTFDLAGRVATVTDGRSQKTTYTYDKDDRITRVLTGGATSCTYTAGTCVSYVYDADGNRTSQHDKTGTTTYGYDVMNRQTSKTLPSATALSVTYDHVGNAATYHDTGGTVTYGYNTANQLTNLAEPGGSCTGTITLCTTFALNNNGQRTSTTYPGNTVMTDTLDNSGRPTEMKAVHGATTISDFSYTYVKNAADSELVQTRVDNKVALTTTYGYDPLNQLTTAVEKNTGGTTTASWLYCYDLAGNRTGSSTTTGATCTAPASTYTYNAANELTATNGTSTGWAYDTAGNETAGRSTTPRTSETYSPSNQLTSLTTGGTATAQTYAGLTNDERVTSGTTAFQYGEQGLANQTVSGTTTSWTRDPAGTLISEHASSASYYYIYDGQGSVTALVTAAGTTTDTYSYDPYGNTRTTTGTLTNPWQYTAGYKDNTGVYHLNARYYDPTTGRFTQQDPANQGPNLYAYAGDDPVNATDGTGLCSWFGCFDDVERVVAPVVLATIGFVIISAGVTLCAETLVGCLVGVPLAGVGGLAVATSVTLIKEDFTSGGW